MGIKNYGAVKDYAPKAKNSFANGKAVFFSRYASQVCYPLGCPQIRLVGEGNAVRPMRDVKPIVEFKFNRYETDDPEIAKGLVLDTENYGRPWGWDISIECIPEVLRKSFPYMTTDLKRDVVCSLADNVPAEDMVNDIPQEIVDQATVEAAKRESAKGKAKACPVPGCGLTVTGEDGETKQMIQKHVAVVHADWVRERKAGTASVKVKTTE